MKVNRYSYVSFETTNRPVTWYGLYKAVGQRSVHRRYNVPRSDDYVDLQILPGSRIRLDQKTPSDFGFFDAWMPLDTKLSSASVCPVCEPPAIIASSVGSQPFPGYYGPRGYFNLSGSNPNKQPPRETDIYFFRSKHFDFGMYHSTVNRGLICVTSEGPLSRLLLSTFLLFAGVR